MKKKGVFIVGLFLVLVLSVNWYSNTRKDESGSGGGTLELPQKKELSDFKPQGTYAKEKLGKYYVEYQFDKPNDKIVVYQTQESKYLVCENTSKKTGKCYASVTFEQDKAKFMALSNEYLLFEAEETIAVDIKDGKEKSFNELSKREQKSFVFFSIYEEKNLK